MTDMKTLPITPEAGFPQRFECRVAGMLLGFDVRYNSEGDFYTIDIYDSDGQPIVYGRPVVYGFDLLNGIVDDRLPDVHVIPVDMAGQQERVGDGTLGTDVHLIIVEPTP